MARYGDLDSQYFDDSGNPVVNGKIYFYETGTTTLKNTYADVNYTIANTNPVVLTAAGRQPNIFFAGVAKAILTTNSGTQILVRDPVGVTTSAFGDPWVSSKTYGANEVVQGSNGQFYTSLVSNNLNNNPVTSTGSWTFLYSVEWSAGTTYTVGSVVTYQTIVYQSILSSNTNQNPSTATTYWTPIQMVWMATQTYGLNANIVGTDGVLYTSLQAGNINHTPASSPTWWAGTSAAAAASASAASTSASSAATSASTATTGASTATTQAGIATTQASSATASASSATASASSASTNAASTLVLYNNYKSEYYGPLSANPTVDPLGGAMTAGDLYWNTTSSEMRTYTGSAWVATYLPATGYAVLSANTFTGAQDWATGTAIASASTINLNTATGNRVHITGTTAITAVTLTRGPRTVIFDGILTLTHNTTTNNLPSASDIITAAGDRAIYESDGTTVYCVSYIKASGAAVVAASSGYVYVTSSFSAVKGTSYLADTSAGAITATLPASPALGDSLVFADAKGTFATYNLTLGRNGNNFLTPAGVSVAEDFILDKNGALITIFYESPNWRIA